MECVAIAPAGCRIASGSADRTVRIWDLDPPGAPVLCLQGHTDEVRSIAFLPGGKSLLSGGHDGIVRLWDTTSGAAKGSLPMEAGKIEALAFSGSGSWRGVGRGQVRLRPAGGEPADPAGHPRFGVGRALSP